MQVPPELLAVRDRRAAQARPREGLGARRAGALLRCNPWSQAEWTTHDVGAPSGLRHQQLLQPLEDAVRWLLERFHYNVGLPWAWAIVGTTIVVRICLVPLTVRQIHSMQSLQKHAPEMKEIQRKYKGDRQKLNEEMMKFYRENNINPAASCLPLLAQLPVFIALYLVLQGLLEARPPPGSDLSWLHIVPSIAATANSHWSGYLLLAIYAGSQVLSTYFMSTTMDKTQRRHDDRPAAGLHHGHRALPGRASSSTG